MEHEREGHDSIAVRTNEKATFSEERKEAVTFARLTLSVRRGERHSVREHASSGWLGSVARAV